MVFTHDVFREFKFDQNSLPTDQEAVQEVLDQVSDNHQYCIVQLGGDFNGFDA